MSNNNESIENIRKRFLAMVEKTPDLYHKNDVEVVGTNDWSVERYILVNKTEDDAFKALNKAMLWRKSFGVNDFNDQYFPEELYKIGEYNSFCVDKEGREVLWVVGKAHHKSQELSHSMREFMVYQCEVLDRKTSHNGWNLILDSSGMGLSNIDMENTKFLIEVIQNYYPNGFKYVVVVDMPWILNATFKLVLNFMNEDLRSSVKFIKRNELLAYLDIDSIPVHLNGKYSQCLNKIPEGVKPLDQLNHTKFTSQQIKTIYSTFKSELK